LSEIALNFALSNFCGVCPSHPQKLYPRCHVLLAASHVAKFRGVAPSTVKVVGANMLNVQPIFNALCKKKLLGDTSPWWGVH